MPKTNQSTLTGAAGEHYILFCLLRLGWIAALAPEGSPNHDIIVTELNGEKFCAIQVKTSRGLGRDEGWHMSEKHEKLTSTTLFYCFVKIQEGDGHEPQVFIIPSKIVAETLKDTHSIWLKSPGRNGQKHKDTKMRRLLPDYSATLKLNQDQLKKYGAGWMDKYCENWKILGLPKVN